MSTRKSILKRSPKTKKNLKIIIKEEENKVKSFNKESPVNKDIEDRVSPKKSQIINEPRDFEKELEVRKAESKENKLKNSILRSDIYPDKQQRIKHYRHSKLKEMHQHNDDVIKLSKTKSFTNLHSMPDMPIQIKKTKSSTNLRSMNDIPVNIDLSKRVHINTTPVIKQTLFGRLFKSAQTLVSKKKGGKKKGSRKTQKRK
jgi:hypothetical protein